ncbi:MAG: hypothetical protein M1814_006324 [Vezdaea aestivalis]|nr:MAG: hypothetical protein M1814_006324 [Vezdaea aestivalis]
MQILNLLLSTGFWLHWPVRGDTLDAKSKGLQINVASCGAYKSTLDESITVASEYVTAAITASLYPTSDPYFYFFRPEQNVTVTAVYTRMLRALSGEGPIIPIFCRNRDPVKDWYCDREANRTGPGAWAVNDHPTPYINICPLILSRSPVALNRCNLPGTPSFIDPLEVWPVMNTRWLEYPSVVDYLVHELSHLHTVVDNDFGTVDMDHFMDQPPFNRHTPVWASHMIAHAEDVKFVSGDLGGRAVEAIDVPTNYEYMSKEAWRVKQASLNENSTSRKRYCHMLRELSAKKRPVAAGRRPSQLSRDELRKFRRLLGLGPY